MPQEEKTMRSFTEDDVNKIQTLVDLLKRYREKMHYDIDGIIMHDLFMEIDEWLKTIK